MPKVAIQIIFTRTSIFASKVIESLNAQTEQDWELFVYDNSCDQEENARVQEALKSCVKAFHFIAGEKNVGFSAHNILFQQHRAPFVFLMQDDAYLAPDYLCACVERLESESRVASVCGLVFRWTQAPNGNELVGQQTRLDTTGLFYRALGNVCDRFASEFYVLHEAVLRDAHPVFGCSGALVVLKRLAVEDVSSDGHLFDPFFFMYKEDVDLAIRLRRKGYIAWFEPKAVAFHRRTIHTEAGNALSRLLEERKRPAHLRVQAYINQWRIYVYHASLQMGAKDWLWTIFAETKRSFALLSSPILFLRSLRMILADFPRAWRLRKTFREMGLNDISEVSHFEESVTRNLCLSNSEISHPASFRGSK